MMKLFKSGLHKSSGQHTNKELKELIAAILEIRSEREMQDFLEGILTPKEMLELPNRLQIVKMLKRGLPQHEIAQKLGVGIATVTRGANEIKKGKFKNV